MTGINAGSPAVYTLMWDDFISTLVSHAARFRLTHPGSPSPTAVQVVFPRTVIDWISPTGSPDPTTPAASADELNEVVRRFSVRAIETRIRAGAIELDDPWQIMTSDADLHELRELLQTKNCSYLHRDGRDDFCLAASEGDKSAVGRVGLRLAAPTTQQACLRCAVPADDLVCSAFSHPQFVGQVLGSGVARRFLATAACGQDRSEIDKPSGCRPEGHACWQRQVSPDPVIRREGKAPEALPMALDLLDLAWRVLNGKDARLLSKQSAASLISTGGSAQSADEFEARVGSLCDVLKRLDIPDTALRHGQAPPPDQTLNRLELVLEPAKSAGSSIDVAATVGVLRNVISMRDQIQHNRREAPASFARLGIPYPPHDWDEAWAETRAAVVIALRNITEAIRTLAEATP